MVGSRIPILIVVVATVLMGKPYTIAAAIGLLWMIHYETLINVHLGPLLRARAPALWTMDPDVLANRRKREADNAGHALAAMHLLIPLAAAAVIVVIGIFKG